MIHAAHVYTGTLLGEVHLVDPEKTRYSDKEKYYKSVIFKSPFIDLKFTTGTGAGLEFTDDHIKVGDEGQKILDLEPHELTVSPYYKANRVDSHIYDTEIGLQYAIGNSGAYFNTKFTLNQYGPIPFLYKGQIYQASTNYTQVEDGSTEDPLLGQTIPEDSMLVENLQTELTMPFDREKLIELHKQGELVSLVKLQEPNEGTTIQHIKKVLAE